MVFSQISLFVCLLYHLLYYIWTMYYIMYQIICTLEHNFIQQLRFFINNSCCCCCYYFRLREFRIQAFTSNTWCTKNRWRNVVVNQPPLNGAYGMVQVQIPWAVSTLMASTAAIVARMVCICPLIFSFLLTHKGTTQYPSYRRVFTTHYVGITVWLIEIRPSQLNNVSVQLWIMYMFCAFSLTIYH